MEDQDAYFSMLVGFIGRTFSMYGDWLLKWDCGFDWHWGQGCVLALFVYFGCPLQVQELHWALKYF
jgi:hypothetical protein